MIRRAEIFRKKLGLAHATFYKMVKRA